MSRHVDPRRLAAPEPAVAPDPVRRPEPGGAGRRRAADWLDLLRQEADGLAGWSLERLLDRLEDRG